MKWVVLEFGGDGTARIPAGRPRYASSKKSANQMAYSAAKDMARFLQADEIREVDQGYTLMRFGKRVRTFVIERAL